MKRTTIRLRHLDVIKAFPGLKTDSNRQRLMVDAKPAADWRANENVHGEPSGDRSLKSQTGLCGTSTSAHRGW
ncbi:hypothetical protein A462_11855 [Pseudomonas sp. Ag1]|nr:hypothetical protein A462_11855 [Pseudomonas sp. Ag1]